MAGGIIGGSSGPRENPWGKTIWTSPPVLAIGTILLLAVVLSVFYWLFGIECPVVCMPVPVSKN